MQACDHHEDNLGVESVHTIASKLQPLLNSHEWKIYDQTASGFEFDEVFERYRAECRIPELFDRIISCFKEIVESGEVDSVRAMRELNELIATLQKARDGSYFATRNAWGFTVAWMQKAGWELLADIPGLRALTQSLRDTLEEGNVGMVALHDKMQTELEAKMSGFPRLEFKPSKLPVLEHHEIPDVETEKAN